MTRRTMKWLCLGAASIPLLLTPVVAHQIQVSEEVGGTLHIEPDDRPKAGEDTQMWFALTLRGGTPVPLSACDCALAIYQLPLEDGESPVDQPDLYGLEADGIPAADTLFAEVGRYQLVLTGESNGELEFSPFQLEFDVTVAR